MRHHFLVDLAPAAAIALREHIPLIVDKAIRLGRAERAGVVIALRRQGRCWTLCMRGSRRSSSRIKFCAIWAICGILLLAFVFRIAPLG